MVDGRRRAGQHAGGLRHGAGQRCGDRPVPGGGSAGRYAPGAGGSFERHRGASGAPIMTTMDFPNGPVNGQSYVNAGGTMYRWSDAGYWEIITGPTSGAFLPLSGGTLTGDLLIDEAQPQVRLKNTGYTEE